MGLASAVTAAFAVVALCTAIFNFWLFLKRRQERAHLWLAIAAMGIVILSAGSALIYESNDLARSIEIQVAQLNAAVLLIVGFQRFSRHFLKVTFRRLELATYAYTAGLVVAFNLSPELMLRPVAELREISLFGQSYVQAPLTPLAMVLLAGLLVALGSLLPIYGREIHRIDVNGRAVFGALCLWLLCGVNDVAVSGGLYPGTYLIGFGYCVFVIFFTAILVGRFVASMEKVEAAAGTLQQLVDARTEELRQKDLALAHGERMATLGTLAAGVAHEINNPIAFISSNLNQLAEAWKEGEAEPVEDLLTETREGVDRIRGIVQELLTLARRGDGVSEPLDLRQVVRSVLPILRHEARNRARIEPLLGDVPPVSGDARLLGQVVLNLALNGLHAMPEGDPHAHRLTIKTAFEDGSAWLIVRDTGTGIPEDVLPHIFDAFFTTKDQGQGTGLGLAVTNQIVSRHRGRLDVETGPDGTAVTVELPPCEPETDA